MTPDHVPTAFFTSASLVLAGLLFLALILLMSRSAANICLAGFVACMIPSPLMLVAHPGAAIAMAAVGLACLVPAFVFAEDHDDDKGPGGGGDGEPDPVAPEPDGGFDPDLWDQFERDFWSHVDRRRELVNA
jgi:hypothetical protein